MKTLGGDAAALGALKNTVVTASLPFPTTIQKKGAIPVLLSAQYDPAKHSFYLLGESCYMICDERRLNTSLSTLVTGQLTLVKGTIKEYDLGRDRQGRFIQKYCLVVRSIEPAVDPLPHLPSSKNRIASYGAVTLVDLAASPAEHAGKPLTFNMQYLGLDKLNKADGLLLGFSVEDNRRFNLPGGIKGLSVIGHKTVAWGAVKGLETGKDTINISGRCFPLHGVDGYSGVFVVDALTTSDGGEVPITPVPGPKINPDDYKKVGQPYLSEIFNICVGKRFLFPLMYRGTENLPESVRDEDFGCKNPTLLKANDNVIGDELLLILPDSPGNLRNALRLAEIGDTLMLRGIIKKLPKSVYCFVVEDLFLPPVQEE